MHPILLFSLSCMKLSNAKRVSNWFRLCRNADSWATMISLPVCNKLQRPGFNGACIVCCISKWYCNASLTSIWRYQGLYPFSPWLGVSRRSCLKTKLQVRNEQRYHGFVTTVVTVWKVRAIASDNKAMVDFQGSNAELLATLTVHLFAYQGKCSVPLSGGLCMKGFWCFSGGFSYGFLVVLFIDPCRRQTPSRTVSHTPTSYNHYCYVCYGYWNSRMNKSSLEVETLPPPYRDYPCIAGLTGKNQKG